jgi:hypothetical protein
MSSYLSAGFARTKKARVSPLAGTAPLGFHPPSDRAAQRAMAVRD